jgi:hypothetical protein
VEAAERLNSANSERREIPNGATDEQRQMPNGARFRTALNSELRGIPKGAKSQRAKTARALFRSLRRSGFRAGGIGAVRNPAVFGTQRRSASGALSQLRSSSVAPFGR